MTIFNTLKEKLISVLVIVAPNWEFPLELMCDTSDYAVGVVIGQRKNKIIYVIYYVSKILIEAQLIYATTEKELLTIVFTLDKFRSCPMGQKVIVYTYHTALKYQLSKKV